MSSSSDDDVYKTTCKDFRNHVGGYGPKAWFLFRSRCLYCGASVKDNNVNRVVCYVTDNDGKMTREYYRHYFFSLCDHCIDIFKHLEKQRIEYGQICDFEGANILNECDFVIVYDTTEFEGYMDYLTDILSEEDIKEPEGE